MMDGSFSCPIHCQLDSHKRPVRNKIGYTGEADPSVRSDDTQTRLQKTATATHLYKRNIPRFMRVLGNPQNTLIDRIHQPNTKKQEGSEPSNERNNQ
ncbi:hypothetical protein CDAR_250221 [Caerostris darwini]|uniref:Uncharacterized protein n=1 Tax=Caerostris darwini TaxID=1538125 RepID=A0AAV4QJJ1_9ARAC|nr:hypothetical protein CDAR_250221 [Caerostris darwini]